MDLASAVGRVFDIQRCALHDGPGIRTTVFLKGCPLSCIWCHNPESQSSRTEFLVNLEQCTACLIAGGDCHSKVTLNQNRTEVVVDYHALTDEDVESCPLDAIRKVGRMETVEAVMKEVLRDQAYYSRSGGGMTLSGGEPLAQIEFTLTLLRAAQSHGVHTCLDTSGFAPRAHLERVMRHTNLFLYDFKVSDSPLHRTWTGVANEQMRSNLHFLYSQGAAIVLRCPVIPGLNDTREHFEGIAELTKRYPRLVGVEVMAYHDMGNYKALRIGRTPRLAGLKTASHDMKTRWLQQLHELGCTEARLG